MSRITRFAILLLTASAVLAGEDGKIFRAGAAIVDVTPPKFPTIVNGMFTERTADKAVDPVNARCIVLDDGTTKIALVVVDSCMLPRTLIDEAKDIAFRTTGIPTDRILVSATHTHSAPSAMGCLGSRPDTAYQAFLPARIAMSIERAVKNIAPAKIGWATAQDTERTHTRSWVFRPDKIGTDPFGEKTVRANMHPGYQSPNAIGPAGPSDPEITILSVQTADGKPLALLANYSMHYYGSPMLSADYYGAFAKKIGTMFQAGDEFVGIMSQGTSGDQWWGDYSQPKLNPEPGMDAYAEAIAKKVFEACKTIQYRDSAPITMRESKITLKFRLADEKRMAWAREVEKRLNGALPKTQPDIYALEQIYLHDRPPAELKLQAIKIGDFGIAAIPNEVYAISGLKIKAHSPLKPTMVIELANGSEGYIPPPEQHRLGGYTTWAARTAGLEVMAEPKIVEGVLQLLESVSDKRRAQPVQPNGAYVNAVMASAPFAYWRMSEFNGLFAVSNTGTIVAKYEDFVAFYLVGPDSAAFSMDRPNRAVHFAGGRMTASMTPVRDISAIDDKYSAECWFWNGMACDLRPVTGYLFSRGKDGEEGAPGDHVGIGGTFAGAGKLIFFSGNKLNIVLTGKTDIPLWTWCHVVFARDGKKVKVFLNGKEEISGEVEMGCSQDVAQIFFGGRNDNFANFEGKIDEAAIYARALTVEEAAAHFKISGMSGIAAAPLPKLNSQPVSPAESLKLLHVKNGFEVDIVASEPLIKSPVAIDWGPDGKLWVVEMFDYPMGLDGKMKRGGRVVVLEDTNGDGKYDKSTPFLENLNYPNGILVWRKGVLITAAPDILYAEDTDGDGKADKTEVLFTGFKEGNLQLRVNGLRYGLDNWVYCSNGWSGGVVTSKKTGQKLDIGRRDLRIKPDSGEMDMQSGPTQFGRNRDDWDNWFGVNNSQPLWHYVLPDQYTRRNPHVAPPDPIVPLTAKNPKIFPLSKPEKRYHSFEHSDRFTSACSAMIYGDSLLFKRGPVEHAFVCEPFHNLVHHLEIVEKGTTFEARRAADEQQSEFLASEDNWFRPVMIRTGPDGALWVVDMYRYMIEHPDWLPAEGKKEMLPFYRAGEEYGRIYRIFPKDVPAQKVPNLAKVSHVKLTEYVTSRNAWVREMTRRMLAWQLDDREESLEQFANPGRQRTPVEKELDTWTRCQLPHVRVEALSALAATNALLPGQISNALQDPDPNVRRIAVRLAESCLPVGLYQDTPLDHVAKLISDPAPSVRLQVAFTLGATNMELAGEVLGRLAVQNYDDIYIRAAVMSSAVPHFKAIVRALTAAGGAPLEAYSNDLISMALSMNDRDALALIVTPLLAPGKNGYGSVEFQSFSKFLNVLSRKNASIEKLAEVEDDLSKALKRTADLFAAARKVAGAEKAEITALSAALSLVGRESSNLAEDIKLLQSFVRPQSPPELQRAAIRALGATLAPDVPPIFIKSWKNASPDIRAAIADECISRDVSTRAFLDALESEKIPRQEIDLPRRERLLKHSQEWARNQAKKVFASTPSTDRQKIVDGHREVLKLDSDANRGATVFARACSACHKIDNVGKEIGPNLRTVTDLSGEALLTSVLDPNRVVEPQYIGYQCSLTSGQHLFGLVVGETEGSILFRTQEDTTQTILRKDIKALHSTKVSLMPEGLETTMTKQELADLIKFLQKR